MFETYFQLQRRPFSSIPSSDQYFPATSIEEARQAVVGIVERQQGPALVVGGVGLGKTLLCEVVADSFRHRCRTVIFPSGRLCTRRALLQVILYELGLPYRDQEESELRLALIDHVTNADLCPNGLLLLVDEADSLTMALLDELRALTNLSRDGNAAIRVVMFGGPRLEERFAHPRLESFNQRLAGRFYLEPFTADETAGHIEQQFAESGGDPDQVFTGGARRSIHNATEGIPRLINQLVDHALVMAAANGQTEIGPAEVDEAWADLQQLPFPTQRRNDTSTNELPSDIIEFGQLSDEDDGSEAVPFEAAESKAETALDSISDQMELIDSESSVADDSSDQEDWPAVETEPEVSLYFHEAHDPFGDDFEEEEVVIDHFVSPDAMSQRHRRQVSCDKDSADIAEQLSAKFPELPCEDEQTDTPQTWNVIGGVEDQSEQAGTDHDRSQPSLDSDDAEQVQEADLPSVSDAHLHHDLHDNDSHDNDLHHDDSHDNALQYNDANIAPSDAQSEQAVAETFDPSAAEPTAETPNADRPVAAVDNQAGDVDTPANEAVHEHPDDDRAEASDEQLDSDDELPINDVSGAWSQPNAEELASQGLHFEEFDLFSTAAEQPAEVEVVSFGPGVPEHAAGEADVDAAIPDEEISDDDFVSDSEAAASCADKQVESELTPQEIQPATPDAGIDAQGQGHAELETSRSSFEANEVDFSEKPAGQRDDDEVKLGDEAPSAPASLSFRDALHPLSESPELDAQPEPVAEAPIAAHHEFDSDVSEKPEDGDVDRTREDVDAASVAELEVVQPVAAAHDDHTRPNIVEAEPKTTKAATAPKRGSDYRRLFSQIRSKRR